MVTSTTNNLGNSAAAVLGGGTTYNPSAGTISAPSYLMYNANGTSSTVNNVDAVINSINSQGIRYIHWNTMAPDSQALGANSMAIGPNAIAGGTGSIAEGNGATTPGTGSNSIAIGTNATVVANGPSGGAGGVAIGSGATAGDPGTAVGTGASALGTNATAMGAGATASNTNAVALGSGSVVTATNSVAIGANSNDGGRPNVVSVGVPGSERQITNVAAGTNNTDVVNVEQLNAGLSNTLNQANSYTNSRIQRLQNSIDSVRKDADSGTAAAMAVAGLPQPSASGMNMVAISGSVYRGQSGQALGISRISENGRWVYKGAVTTNTRGSYGVVVGGGYQW